MQLVYIVEKSDHLKLLIVYGKLFKFEIHDVNKVYLIMHLPLLMF